MRDTDFMYSEMHLSPPPPPPGPVIVFMFCCSLLYVHSSIAIILMGKRELIALLNLSSWCLVMCDQEIPSSHTADQPTAP